jgi:hypothetical protein
MKANVKSAGQFSGRCLATAIMISFAAFPLLADSNARFGNSTISLEWEDDGHLTSMEVRSR